MLQDRDRLRTFTNISLVSVLPSKMASPDALHSLVGSSNLGGISAGLSVVAPSGSVQSSLAIEI